MIKVVLARLDVLDKHRVQSLKSPHAVKRLR